MASYSRGSGWGNVGSDERYITNLTIGQLRGPSLFGVFLFLNVHLDPDGLGNGGVGGGGGVRLAPLLHILQTPRSAFLGFLGYVGVVQGCFETSGDAIGVLVC